MKRRKPIELWDSEKDEHGVEFRNGQPVAVICSKLGRGEIA